MNKKRISFSIIIIASFLLINTSVSASPPPPAPKCNISGIIQSVEFIDAYQDECLKIENGCPTDSETNHPARYYLEIKADSVNYVSGDTSFYTCEKMLPLDNPKIVSIIKDSVKVGDIFTVGQKITGEVTFLGTIHFNSYELDSSPIGMTSITQSNLIIIGFGVFVICIIIVFLVLILLRKRRKF
ncbi:MAG: hypothetical protein WCJ58_01360 [bacterium]